MADAGFFRGTSAEQDNRFRDKQKKLLKSIRFEEILGQKIDMEKVNVDVLKPWVTTRITEILGFEDDVVLEFILNMLDSEKHPDPKVMQINITGFLQAKNARIFMGELWELLVSAQENIGGIPSQFLEKKKEEIKQRKLEQERIQANLKKQGELLQAEADSTGMEETQNGGMIDDADLPEEVRKARQAASKLAESMGSTASDGEVVSGTDTPAKGGSGVTGSKSEPRPTRKRRWRSDSREPQTEPRPKMKRKRMREKSSETETNRSTPKSSRTKRGSSASGSSSKKEMRAKRFGDMLGTKSVDEGYPCTAMIPVGRNNPPHWMGNHNKLTEMASKAHNEILLVGDSMVKGLARYRSVWRRYFAGLGALNFGIGGDRTQHVLWRLQNGELEFTPEIIILHCGTNNINQDPAGDVARGLLAIVDVMCEKTSSSSVIVTGLLPRDLYPSFRRSKIVEVNSILEERIDFSDNPKFCNVHFLKPADDWVLDDGLLNESLYHTDYLHLIEAGDEKFAKAIVDLIEEVRRKGGKQTTQGDLNVLDKVVKTTLR